MKLIKPFGNTGNNFECVIFQFSIYVLTVICVIKREYNTKLVYYKNQTFN